MFQMPGPRVMRLGIGQKSNLVQNCTVCPLQFFILVKMRRNLSVFFRKKENASKNCLNRVLNKSLENTINPVTCNFAIGIRSQKNRIRRRSFGDICHGVTSCLTGTRYGRRIGNRHSFQFEWQAVGERMRPVISFVGCVVDPENDPVRKVLLRRQGEKAGDNMFLFITHGDRHNS
ncbi:hypothetical protein AD941_07075 [Gluconobacter albidus]|uniref:Uncharacterized protein n=1 Tax=Gluconobacter albidus TaxID=318683 RepID=A0AAW3QY58_9PROT|nr:hypothetical protein AD941_07075 [Gluconobacter albidus]